MPKETDVFVIFGGSGFVGRYLLRRIARSNARIKVIGRSSVPQPKILMSGAVGQITTHKSPSSEKEWTDLLQNATHVINLVGILNESKAQTFEQIHVELAKNIAKYSKKSCVKKLIHVSALTNKSKSKYALSKMSGEKAVLKEYSNAVIIRPSLIFGPEDKSINMFASLVKYFPVIPMFVKGVTKFQPIYVDDVAQVIEKCCDMDDNAISGKIFEIGGKNQYSMFQLFQMISAILNKKRLFVPIPFYMSIVLSSMLELCRLPLITKDQVVSLKSNSVLHNLSWIDFFDINPTDLRHTLDKYIT